MKLEELEAGNWIDRLARALRGLSEAQGPFLRDYWRHNPRERVVVTGGTRRRFRWKTWE